MPTILTASALFDGNRIVQNPVITLDDDRVASISSRTEAALPPDAHVLDFPGATLAPAFLDIHIHGAAGHDVMEATPEALSTMGQFLASRGTANFLATTVTAPLDATLRSLEGLAKLIAHPHLNGTARPLGIHLEGPFLSHVKARRAPAGVSARTRASRHLRPLFEAAEGHVRLMTLAPELPGASELAAHATQARRPHLCRPLQRHRTLKPVPQSPPAPPAQPTPSTPCARSTTASPEFSASCSLTITLCAELICDGIHSAPEMARLWWRAKGPQRAILVTDAMSAAGMPDGEYQLGGFAVNVAGGRATRDGVLAGSVLTLDRALANCIQFTGATVEQSLRLLTANPSALIGVEDRAGAVAIGRAANLVAVSSAGKLLETILNGKPVSMH